MATSRHPAQRERRMMWVSTAAFRKQTASNVTAEEPACSAGCAAAGSLTRVPATTKQMKRRIVRAITRAVRAIAVFMEREVVEVVEDVEVIEATSPGSPRHPRRPRHPCPFSGLASAITLGYTEPHGSVSTSHGQDVRGDLGSNPPWHSPPTRAR